MYIYVIYNISLSLAMPQVNRQTLTHDSINSKDTHYRDIVLMLRDSLEVRLATDCWSQRMCVCLCVSVCLGVNL